MMIIIFVSVCYLSATTFKVGRSVITDKIQFQNLKIFMKFWEVMKFLGEGLQSKMSFFVDGGCESRLLGRRNRNYHRPLPVSKIEKASKIRSCSLQQFYLNIVIEILRLIEHLQNQR